MSTPAGWYPDPSHQAQLRWWDGERWTEHTHTAAPTHGPGLDLRKDTPGSGDPRQHGQQHRPYPTYGAYGDPAAGRSSARALATPDGRPLGNLGLRLLARVVDWILVSVIATLAGWSLVERMVRAMDDTLTAAVAGDPTASLRLLEDPGFNAALSSFTFVLIAVSAVYTVLPLRFYGATPGKALFGLRVRHWERPGHPTWGQSILRWLTSDLAVQLFWPYAVLDYLWPTWDRRKQALHDKPAGTVVVRRR
ncbi:RDD family protein [Paenibacillus sp. TRM 82003]|uniref:RDD family protein n=1 Tax=Kineococcus sp. TRM81007 TaxID=2925831 RepID=UPI001F58A965|nr:RDD family protein [Kineococcus sp. TRM81007]MCI2239799.1 RDD family protein [Kineococcus sp. TRM81007]MCI3925898.1 RDD family protein [Paenibacillus sp. TRM 82003]